jgi:ribose transport system substrate-binding protein
MNVNKFGRGGRRLGAALSATALAAAALALGACGSSDSDNSSNASASTGASTTASTTANAKAPWCGTKSITLGIQDGGGLNAWSAASLAEVKKEAALCPAIKKTIVVNAGFDAQKGTSGIQSMIAQGANAIVIIPDSGVCAELPSLRQATQRGIKVATWGASACGTPGKDYLSYSDWDPEAQAKLQAEWLIKQMGDKGNIMFLGGPAGNLVDQGSVKGLLETVKAHPNVKVLDNISAKSWPVTNWDPAQAQKTAAGLLAKYPKVDGLFDAYGASVQGEIKAFKNANRKIPPIATVQLNSLSCAYAKAKGTDGAFALSTVSNRNWIGRLAVRRAVAAVNDITINQKDIVALPLLEDSSDSALEPKCYADKGPDYDPSNDQTDEQIDKLVAG